VRPAPRRALKRAYRPGQELEGRPSQAWLRATAEAIQAVALQEQSLS
jgi:hypothetical protein